jgi:hypothetical protein
MTIPAYILSRIRKRRAEAFARWLSKPGNRELHNERVRVGRRRRNSGRKRSGGMGSGCGGGWPALQEGV